MNGKWITGKEIMEKYGKAAAEIGQACYDGVLHAVTADVLIPVIEESKIGHIPKYPPVGVDPRDHIQYTATPHWDWSEHVKFDRKELCEKYEFLRKEYDDIARNSHPNECPTFDTFVLISILNNEPSTTRKLRDEGLISSDLDLSKLNPEAMNAAHTHKYEKDREGNIIVPNLALFFMENMFDYYTNISENVKTFCFLFPTFKKWKKDQSGDVLSVLSESEIVSSYKETLEIFWFEGEEVLKWAVQTTMEGILTQTGDQNTGLPQGGSQQETDKVHATTDLPPQNYMDSVQAPAAGQSLIPVNVPSSKWAGKTPEMVYTALKDEYSLEVIAMVINLVSKNKTANGRALAKDDIDKGDEKDARTYQRFFDNFLCRGNAKYLLTFDE